MHALGRGIIGEPESAAWLSFVELSVATKTKAWDVRSRRWGFTLGRVKWFGRWRRYAFFPEPQTTFDAECLRDIQRFLEFQMALRTSNHPKAS